MGLTVTRGKVPCWQRVVLYGTEGIGKSTLASEFPKPLFIDVEDSTQAMDVHRLPKPGSWAALLSMVSALKHDTMGYETLVLDTADWAEMLCIKHVCSKANMESIEDFGYGKGFVKLQEEFARLLEGLGELPMHVVLTAHAQTKKFELPEETGAYDRWEMKLSKNVRPMVKEWATMILFCNYQIFLTKQSDEKNKVKKAGGGQRVMYTSHNPCWDAKNRENLPDVLPLEFKGIAHLFVPPTAGVAPVVASAPAPAPVVTTPSPAAKGPREQLRECMAIDAITPEQLIAAIVAKGFFPAGTEFDKLPDDFINTALLPNWSKVVKSIKGE